MSHIHNLGGNLNAAAEYQEYLARLSADRRARRNAESEEQGEVKTFDSAIDPDSDAAEEHGGNPEGEREDEPRRNPDDEQGLSVKV